MPEKKCGIKREYNRITKRCRKKCEERQVRDRDTGLCRSDRRVKKRRGPRRSRSAARRKSRKRPVRKRSARKRSARKRPSRKRSVRIKVKNPGSLTELGYHLLEPAAVRRAALARAVARYGYRATMGKVNLLYVYNKNKNKKHAAIATADKNWLKKNY